MTNPENEVKELVEKQFGDSLTVEDLWALVRLVKHCRRYCRSNAALNNMLNRMFSYAQFREVQKINPITQESYPGLQITAKGEVAAHEEAA